MLNNSGESGQPCPVPDLRGNGFKIYLRNAFKNHFTWNYVSGHGQVASIGTTIPKMTTINSDNYKSHKTI